MLVEAERVRVSLRLPDSPDVLTFAAVIRHRRALGRGLEYGAFFDEKEMVDFQEKRQRLVTYLEQRTDIVSQA